MACEVKTGIDTSDSTPPRLGASVNSRMAQRGIGRRLQIQQLRARPDRPLVFFIGRGIDERGLDIQLGQPLREEFCHSAANIALSHDVIARLQQGQDCRGDGAHAGRKT